MDQPKPHPLPTMPKQLKGYELQELIGQGGFGIVYRAYQPIIEREVALKVILPQYANTPSFIRRFETEARLIAKLDHIHIVPLYDYWRDPDSTCLVMRWLRGGNLQTLIDRTGALDLTTTNRILTQIASALTTAHRNGIVHRDLKPANILLDEDYNAYLADFGIAKILDPNQTDTPEADRYGSPDYVSPEQVTGHPISPQTDIYSLGVVLYTMLTGTRPFADPSMTTVIRKHVYEPLPPLQDIRPNLPHTLNVIIWKATSKQPEARYPDALSLAEDFERVVNPIIDPHQALTQLSMPPVPTRILTLPINQTLDFRVLDPPNPYKGLQPFGEEDADNFFGREKTIEELLTKLAKPETSHFLAIVGPSGSGKSSLIKAGLLPKLRSGSLAGSQNWFIIDMVPGTDPFNELETALLKVALQLPPNFAKELRDIDKDLSKTVYSILPESTSLVLFIDQFEELFTTALNNSIISSFLTKLAQTVSTTENPLRIIITLRADFYDRPLLHPQFGNLLKQNTYIVLPLSIQEMERAILGPADRLKFHFEPGVVSAILEDISQQPGALPLLQFTLTELFEKRDGYILTRSAYNEMGGISRALSNRAEALYQQQDETGQEIIRQLFLRLTTLTDNGDHTRRRIPQSELTTIAIDKNQLTNILNSFGKYRLITFDREAKTRTPTVEIAHEALIRTWERLHEWLETNRDQIYTHRRLAAATQSWIESGKDKSFLATGTQLSQFETLLSSPSLILNNNERIYIQNGLKARQRAANRARLFTIILSLITIAAITFALLAIDQQSKAISERNRADIQAKESRSRELAVIALAGRQPIDLSLLLALAALGTANTLEARNSLLLTLQSQPHLLQFLHNDSPVRAVAYSPDGSIIASADSNGNIKLWSNTTGTIINEIRNAHNGQVNSLTFNKDGKLIASAGADKTVRIWRVTTSNNIPTLEPVHEPLTGHLDAVWAVSFSPDSEFIASGGADGKVFLWDAHTLTPVGNPVQSNNSIVYSVIFHPKSAQLLSAGDSNTVQTWFIQPEAADTALTPEPELLHGPSNWILTAAISPDGQLLAASGADTNIFLWNLESKQLINQINTNHTNWIRQLAFSSDGLLLASASQDNTVQLWHTATGESVIGSLNAHQAGVWCVAFSPASQTFISGGADQKLIKWSIREYTPFLKQIGTHNDAILTIAFNPNGQEIASGGGSPVGEDIDNAIHIWTPTQPNQERLLEGHTRYITALNYTPNGKSLVSASADHTIRLWDSQTGHTLNTWILPDNSIPRTLAISPDGQLVVIGDDSGNIIRWSITDGTLIDTPRAAHTGAVFSLVFSSDGQTLISGGRDGKIKFWDTQTGQEHEDSAIENDSPITALIYSPNSQLLISGSSDGEISLWNSAGNDRTAGNTFTISDEVSTLDISSDGKTLAVGSLDNTITFWDIEAQQSLGQPIHIHNDWITDIAFSPDGKSLASASVDGSIKLWNIDPAFWQFIACTVSNRNLSTQEWSRYFPETPYQETCSGK